jgi:hypothetical protein
VSSLLRKDQAKANQDNKVIRATEVILKDDKEGEEAAT